MGKTFRKSKNEDNEQKRKLEKREKERKNKNDWKRQCNFLLENE